MLRVSRRGFTCALMTDLVNVKCWGYAANGELGLHVKSEPLMSDPHPHSPWNRLPTQRALRGILMPRGKNWLPTVSRQFVTRSYPHPNCLLKCLPNCLSPTRDGFFSSFKIAPAMRVIARQLSGKDCLAAIFVPRRQDVSSGPLGRWPKIIQNIYSKTIFRRKLFCNDCKDSQTEVYPVQNWSLEMS